jgi:hypothetical protein
MAELRDDGPNEDMGFGRFDDDATASASPHIQLESARKKQKVEQESGTLLQRLIARQSFEGSWEAIYKLPYDEMKFDGDAASLAVTQMTELNADQILATAIVVLFLETKMQDEEETWELVVEKARAWLESEVAEDVLTRVWQLAGVIGGKN